MNFMKPFTRKKQEVAPVAEQILTNELLMKRSVDADIKLYNSLVDWLKIEPFSSYIKKRISRIPSFFMMNPSVKVLEYYIEKYSTQPLKLPLREMSSSPHIAKILNSRHFRANKKYYLETLRCSNLASNSDAFELFMEKVNKRQCQEYIPSMFDDYDEHIWMYLAENTDPNAIKYITENIQKIKQIKNTDTKEYFWNILSTNPSAIELLNRKSKYINWNRLLANKNAMELIRNNMEKITDWTMLSANTNDEAIEMLKQDPSKINWQLLASNENPKAVEMLENEFKRDPNKYVMDTTLLSNLFENASAMNLIKDIFNTYFSDTDSIELTRINRPFSYLLNNPGIFRERIGTTTMNKIFQKATKKNHPNMAFQNTANINQFLGGGKRTRRYRRRYRSRNRKHRMHRNKN